jgi:hypothetical protein
MSRAGPLTGAVANNSNDLATSFGRPCVAAGKRVASSPRPEANPKHP